MTRAAPKKKWRIVLGEGWVPPNEDGFCDVIGSSVLRRVWVGLPWNMRYQIVLESLPDKKRIK